MRVPARVTASLTAAAIAAFAIAFAGCGGGGKSTGPQPGPRGTVHGIVRNAADNSALAGVTVTASSGGAATTDAQGRFSISVAANQAVRLDVTKNGFSLNQLVVTLAQGQSKSYSVGLMAEGATEVVTVSAGGVVTDPSSNAVITLPAGFVTAAGNVNVTITGLDPTSNQIAALPGGLEALDANGQPAYLFPVSFAEYTVKDNAGNVLPFNPSASQGADIELPIPALLQGQPGYEMGDPIECYVYDPADGKWKTPVPGVIGPSSVNGEPAIKATIFHLSWYGGAPASSDIGCIEGEVTLNGVPQAGVDVEAFPGGSATTDAQGRYRVQAALNSQVRVVATVLSGATFRIGEGMVQVGPTSTPCAELDIPLGSLQQGNYEIQALLMTLKVFGTATEVGLVYVYIEAGEDLIGVDGATVEIGTGSSWTTFTGQQDGYYASPPSFNLVPGALYNLRVDFTSDGAWDATGTVRNVGLPVVTSPAANATVGSSFTASWTDPGTSVGGYTAKYFGFITAGDTAMTNVFLTTSSSEVVGDGVKTPAGYPDDPLVAGEYQLQLYAGNGPFFFFDPDSSYLPNVTGTGVTGYFSSIAVADTVAFSSNGTTAGRRVSGIARSLRPLKWDPRIEADLRRLIARKNRAPLSAKR